MAQNKRATTAPTTTDVDALIDLVYGDKPAIRVNPLAEGVGVHEHTIRKAIAAGELATLRISERGTVIFRESARRWLTGLQQQDGET